MDTSDAMKEVLDAWRDATNIALASHGLPPLKEREEVFCHACGAPCDDDIPTCRGCRVDYDTDARAEMDRNFPREDA